VSIDSGPQVHSTNNQPPGGPGPTPHQFDSASTIQVESDATSNDDLNPPAAPGREFRDIIDHHRQLVTNLMITMETSRIVY
jgi:hypothetical protein